MTTQGLAAVAWLRSPAAIRTQCHHLLALAEQNRLPYFTLDISHLEDAADYVAAVTRENYPSLQIPYHSRWRHFEIGGISRWQPAIPDPAERARSEIDLCTISVLLDAGAGSAWRYRDPQTGHFFSRSEGLALASLDAFRAGLFSSDPDRPLRADAAALSAITPQHLAAIFQLSPANELIGLPGRVTLLRNLGATLTNRPDLFGPDARPGHLFDYWRAASLHARDMLRTLLDAFAPIWPGRIVLAGQNLGDVWTHPSAGGEGDAAGLVPFHKLSQWLCYSLIEVLEQVRRSVAGLDALTGLAEYRNGGLLIDLGVLSLRDPALAQTALPVSHPAIVEWRALTIALLDRLAPLVRARLARTEAELPLARLLQGGTWAAGRRIANQRRADGSPPITVASDGSVF
jgi:Protein of unknown function (DUF1688)